MRKYKPFFLAVLAVPFLCILFQAGCARNQKRAIAKAISDTVLNPCLEAAKMQQWEAVQQYLAEDVQITTENQQGSGKTYVVEWYKNSPVRKFSDIQVDTAFLEVHPDQAVARVNFTGSKEIPGGTEFLNVSERIKFIKKDNRWLIHELIYDTLEVFRI